MSYSNWLTPADTTLMLNFYNATEITHMMNPSAPIRTDFIFVQLHTVVICRVISYLLH